MSIIKEEEMSNNTNNMITADFVNMFEGYFNTTLVHESCIVHDFHFEIYVELARILSANHISFFFSGRIYGFNTRLKNDKMHIIFCEIHVLPKNAYLDDQNGRCISSWSTIFHFIVLH